MSTVIVIGLLCGGVLIIFGGLLGHSLSQVLLAGDLRRRSELARRTGEQLRALMAERTDRDHTPCPCCGWSREAGRIERDRVPT